MSRIVQSNQFKKKYKKLHSNEKNVINEKIREIVDNLDIGRQKKGDLSDCRVYKFKVKALQYLLAYRIIKPDSLELVALGSHENFYQNIKRIR